MDPWAYAKAGCSEHASQTALFMWCKMAERVGIRYANDAKTYSGIYDAALAISANTDLLPQLKWLFAIPNGGERAKSVAANLRAEGAKSGVYDVFFPVPRPKRSQFGGHTNCHFSGLFIEMKKEEYRNRKDGGCSQAQLDFGAAMLAAGYDAVVCYSWLEARDAILKYLGV